MGGTGKKNEPAKNDQAGKSSPAPIKRDDPQQDEIEDGDIATPKRDLDSDDDQPL